MPWEAASSRFMNAPSIYRGAFRKAGALALVATILALFFATKDSIHEHVLGLQITWGKNLWWKAMEWYAWGALSPLIFGVCRRFNFSARPWQTLVAHAVSGTFISLLHCCVLTTGALIESQVLHTGFSWPGLFKFIFANHFHENVLTYAALVSVWHALEYHDRFKEREHRAAELEAHLTRARLFALKTQLQPHFLFNTLNGIAAMTYENPKGAHRMLATLSELLRASLNEHGDQEITLRSELDFNRRYLELEQIRFGPRLSVEWDIAPESLDANVPNLLLQPLIENALKHAIAPFSKPGRITISSRRDNGTLVVRVSDNGPGLVASVDPDTSPGIGLKNTQARLQAIYGPQQRLEFKQPDGGGLAVEIAIPFRAASSPGVVSDFDS